jgi:hypothetical protein
MRRRLLFVALLGLALPACLGDPKKETEISMAPGLYEVELPGARLAGFDMDEPGEPTKKLCLRPGDGAFFAHRVVRETVNVPGCGDPVNERTGNLLATTILCSINEDGVKGDAYLRGSGRIREEEFSSAFKVDLSEIEIEDPEAQEAARMLQAMQSVGSISVSATRVGDCPA